MKMTIICAAGVLAAGWACQPLVAERMRISADCREAKVLLDTSVTDGMRRVSANTREAIAYFNGHLLVRTSAGCHIERTYHFAVYDFLTETGVAGSALVEAEEAYSPTRDQRRLLKQYAEWRPPVAIEAKIEGYLRDEIAKLGGWCEKHVSPGTKGPPDNLVYWPLELQMQRFWLTTPAMPHTEFIETKAPHGRVSVLQQRDHARRRAMGFQGLGYMGHGWR